jgi:hypothetical protein
MSIVLMGSTSGSCTLQEQAVAGSTTLTLPTFNGTVGLLVSGTAVASTSGTSIDFTSIPAGVRRVTVMFDGVSTNGTSSLLIQLGDSGGIENTGYLSTSITDDASGGSLGVNSTAGFVYYQDQASYLGYGITTIVLVSGNVWVSSHTGRMTTTNVVTGGGGKTLSDTLDRVRITTVNGTDTFDAGSINILYE